MDLLRFIPRVLQLEEREVPAALSAYDVMGAIISVQFDANTLQYAYQHPNSFGSESLAVATMIATTSPALSQTLLEAASQLQQGAPPTAALNEQIEFFSSLAITAQLDAAGGQFYVNEINQALAAAPQNGGTSTGTTGTGFPVGTTGTGTGTTTGTSPTGTTTGTTPTGTTTGTTPTGTTTGTTPTDTTTDTTGSTDDLAFPINAPQ